MTSLLKNLAPPYDTDTEYETNQYCEYNSEIYVCKEDTTGEFDLSKWQKVFITDFIKGQLNSNLATFKNNAKFSTTPSKSANVIVGNKYILASFICLTSVSGCKYISGMAINGTDEYIIYNNIGIRIAIVEATSTTISSDNNFYILQLTE